MNTTLICCLVTISMVGCKESHHDPAAWTPGTDIYFAGADSDQAVYWKNGVETVLPGGHAEAGGIAVVGSRVYVAGDKYSAVGVEPIGQAVLWKDGVKVLTDSGGYCVSGPVVVGTDVYMAGWVINHSPSPISQAAYWKNGRRVDLDTTSWSDAMSIAVVGTDVYVAGGVDRVNTNFDSSVVWKNGQRMSGVSTFNIGNSVKSYNYVAVSGGNVYVVEKQGYFVNSANQYQPLPHAEIANSIFLNGTDVYVTGTRVDDDKKSWAAYWKNGVLDTLPQYPGTIHSGATALVIAGSDVYVGGFAWMKGADWAVYWKNGVEGVLSKNGNVNGMAIGN